MFTTLGSLQTNKILMHFCTINKLSNSFQKENPDLELLSAFRTKFFIYKIKVRLFNMVMGKKCHKQIIDPRSIEIPVKLTALHTEVTDLLVMRIGGKLHRAGEQ